VEIGLGGKGKRNILGKKILPKRAGGTSEKKKKMSGGKGVFLSERVSLSEEKKSLKGKRLQKQGVGKRSARGGGAPLRGKKNWAPGKN